MSASRTKKAMMNTICELLLEVVAAVCAFILPRLILRHFGSAYNGVSSSISQFIGCIALLKSGIGGVTRAALYQPLANRDSRAISEVVNATGSFMKKLALFFCVIAIGIAAIYPLLVQQEFSWFFTFSLVLIMSVSTFFQYYFGLTYQIVLQADQRNYILSIVSIITTILNTAVASFLIIRGFGIHVVKIGSALIFVFPPLFYNLYVKKRYGINKTVPGNAKLIDQRWDAFGHQIAAFINQNTDVILVTAFLGVREVSVYSIHYMVAHAIQKIIKAVSTGTTAAFGNMLAKGEKETLSRRFSEYELLMFYISTTLITVTGIMLTPFIRIYTSNITDVNYHRPLFSALVSISVFLACIKMPYEQMVHAAGAFRQTRNGAFAEAIINIVLSVLLVNLIGLNGVIVGTIIAIGYRTIRYSLYVCNTIIPDKRKTDILLLLGYTVGCALVCTLLSRVIPLDRINGYVSWVLWAAVTTLATAAVTTGFGLLMFRARFVGIVKLGMSIVMRKSRKKHG